MIRVQFQIPVAEYEQLRRIAAREQRSTADCIREGIRWFLQRAAAPTGDALAEIAGKFKPQPTDDLKDHDGWQVEAIVRSKRGGNARLR